jgi:hypothetical protein
MARLLNAGVLPAGYYAVPFLDDEGPVEIDVAALRDGDARTGPDAGGPTRPWTAAEPALTVAVEWPVADAVRVEVFSDEGDPRLAAAVELVSPRNKDRPRSREAFAAKCAGHLRRGCGVVVVDAVTTRRADLYADLLAALGGPLGPAGAQPGRPALGPTGLSAVSYRAEGRDGAGRLLAWPFPLEIGRSLPTVPLWLSPDLAVPLDLEASHSAACDDLRIRRAG